MINAQFISQEYLKDTTPLSDAIDPNRVTSFIMVAQDKYIRDATGDNLYFRLCLGLTSSTLNADEIYLLRLCKPALAYYTCYEALPFIHTHISNLGVHTTQDNKQTSVDAARLASLRNEIKSNAEYYMSRVNNYLINNHLLFPEYDLPNTDVNPNKNKNAFTCDLYLDPKYIDERWIKQYYRE